VTEPIDMEYTLDLPTSSREQQAREPDAGRVGATLTGTGVLAAPERLPRGTGAEADYEAPAVDSDLPTARPGSLLRGRRP
jgi:hypothetical protein